MTHRQDMFCHEYLIDLNAAQAAIRAGYAPRSARQIGHALLQRDDVQQAINAAMTQRRERLRLDADRVIYHLRCIAYADIRSLYTDDARPLPIGEISPDLRAAIIGVTYDGQYILADKLQALSMLLRHTATGVDTATQPHIRFMQQGV